MAYNTVVISSGHSINCQGASDIINEVTEARKVVDRVYEIIKANGKACYKYHDTAKSASTNLVNIVSFHNKYKDGIDVSIHFNAYSHTDKSRGVEVCYYSARNLAAQVSKAIAESAGFIDRGPKERKGLYFLSHCSKPAILIEVCFVDSVKDVELYKANFEKICQAIAKALIGDISNTTVATTPAKPTPTPSTNSNTVKVDNWVKRLQQECNKQGFSNQVVDGIPGPATLKGCPLLKIGAKGNITKLLQERLGVSADGIFGKNTKSAVIKYQKSKGLSADGIVGQNTWKKLLGL